MKLQTQFKHIESSPKLTKHAEEKLERLDKFELKPSEIKIIFSAKHHECHAEICIRAPDHVYFRGTGIGEDHYVAMDRAFHKLETQLAKHKSKVQFHKKKMFSKEGRLSRMNSQMEHFHSKQRMRKSSRAA
jgi:putative sigma-54 modulation protein